jgi:outer membrane protein TolC
MLSELLPSRFRIGALAFVLLVALLASGRAAAQTQERPRQDLIPSSTTDSTDRSVVRAVGTDAPTTLTVNDAIRVALEKNFDVRGAKLDVRNADAQVREAWGQVLPQVDVNAGYTRNVLNANPFAGSDVSAIFGGGNRSDWVAFNEDRRLDGDPTTEPISYDEFLQRQRRSAEQAGVNLGGGSDNPFGVDNEFQTGVQVTQTLYNGSAFAAISGAEQFKAVTRFALDRQMQVVSNEVYEAYYRALLAEERARVVKQRVERTRQTLQEISTQVAQGVTAKYQRLSAEVDLSNARTELIDAENQADLALESLKNTLGLSPDAPIELAGRLDAPRQDDFLQISATRAVDRAMNQRPDLERARLNVELEQIRRKTTRSQYLPRVSAVANFNYTGRVPDDRTIVNTTNPQDPTDPFFYEQSTLGFFNDSYWNPSVSVGLNLTWNLFNGFQTTARMQQDAISIQQAEVQLDRLQRGVELEVSRAMRTLETARERIQSQQQTLEVAETNYEYTAERVEEGVSSQVELRQASDQLDQTRLNYLNAVFDYLVARSDLETALGRPLTEASARYQMTSR